MNKALKNFARLLLVLMAGFSIGFADQPAAPDLSGTWVSEKNGKTTGEITLVIEQADPQIKIKETRVKKGAPTSRELTYFADARGETNPSLDGKTQLKSVSKWSGRKLIVKFYFVESTFDETRITNERVDEWNVSSDGKTLTLIRSVTSTPVGGQATNSRYTIPPAQRRDVLSAPLHSERTQKFEKVS